MAPYELFCPQTTCWCSGSMLLLLLLRCCCCAGWPCRLLHEVVTERRCKDNCTVLLVVFD